MNGGWWESNWWASHLTIAMGNNNSYLPLSWVLLVLFNAKIHLPIECRFILFRSCFSLLRCAIVCAGSARIWMNSSDIHKLMWNIIQVFKCASYLCCFYFRSVQQYFKFKVCLYFYWERKFVIKFCLKLLMLIVYCCLAYTHCLAPSAHSFTRTPIHTFQYGSNRFSFICSHPPTLSKSGPSAVHLRYFWVEQNM